MKADPKITRIQKRIADAAVKIYQDPGGEKNAVFQHSILCQTYLPYRNPHDQTAWERRQGNAILKIETNKIIDPVSGEMIPIGLPYGPKARLILAHINTEAVKTGEREVNVGDSMTAFVRRLGLDTGGRTENTIKDQLRRLAASFVTLAYKDGKSYSQKQSFIIEMFDVWFPKDDRQRVLWESTIELGEKYFQSLMEHAVPLDERALAALSHNCLAMDMYTWLAQRLHRVPGNKPQFVGWQDMKEQFGLGYKDMKDFKKRFRKELKTVMLEYPRADIREIRGKGFRLFNSPPPITSRLIQVPKLIV